MLTTQDSDLPGPWRTDNAPYLREIMDAFCAEDIEEIVLACSTQYGKTQMIFNVLGYVVHQDPAPAMIVYPNETLAKSVSKNRLRPMVEATPVLSERYDPRKSEFMELQFWGAYVALSGANSPASLSSRPIKYLLMDEVDKFPKFLGDEADPISLAKERTKAFPGSKILIVSSPTTEDGHVWSHLESCDRRKEYYVPCPECGEMQKLIFSQVKWPKELTEAYENAGHDKKEMRRLAQRARDVATYECLHCHAKIPSDKKMGMLRKGKWRDEFANDSPPRRIGFHGSSLYSPWLSFGDVAAEFLESKDYPEKLRNFVQGWLGEPWREKTAEASSDMVRRQAWNHPKGKIPVLASPEKVLLTAGIDIQKGHAYYVIRAWGPNMTSWLVDYDRFETWDEQDLIAQVQRRIVDPLYYVEDRSGFYQVSLGMIDIGYRTDDAYAVCLTFPDVFRPCKGSSRQLDKHYVVQKIERLTNMERYETNTDLIKDFIFGRMQKPPGSRGSWMVCKNVTADYAEQVVSEVKVAVTDRRTGAITYEWRPVSQHADNHYLDCEVYATLAARILGMHVVADDEEEAAATAKYSPPPKQRSGWMQRGR